MGSGLHTLVRTRGHLHYPNMEGEGPWLTAQVCLHFFPNRTHGFSLVFLEAPRYFLLQYTHICSIPFRDSIPRPPMLPFAFSCSQPRAFCSFSQLPSHLQITDLACFLESASQPGPLQPQRLPLGAFSLAISPPYIPARVRIMTVPSQEAEMLQPTPPSARGYSQPGLAGSVQGGARGTPAGTQRSGQRGGLPHPGSCARGSLTD